MTNTVGNIILECHPERSEGSIPPLKAVRRFEGGLCDGSGMLIEIPACAGMGMTDLNLITEK